MPREQINTVDLDFKQRMTAGDDNGQQPPSGYGPTNDPAVHVSWHPGDDHAEGHVQVAIEVDLDYLRFAADSPNGERDDRTLLYTPALTRTEINHMIRTLRRARAAAFGSDE